MTAWSRPAVRTYWLVDLENTHSRWTMAAHEFLPDDTVVLFWSKAVTKVLLDDVSCCERVKYMFVKCTNGTPNAMDFQIAAWLGRMSACDPSAGFVILSGDRGYSPLTGFMDRFGTRVQVADPASFGTKAMQDCILERGPQLDLEPEPQLEAQPEPTLGPAPKADPDPCDGKDGVWLAYRQKLMDAGVSDPQDLVFLPNALYISMQSPQNKRKIGVRNRMMAHYGAQEGNLRYLGLKDLIHDIAANGPYPDAGGQTKMPGPTVHEVNVALGQASIPLHTGQAAKAAQAIADAMMSASPKDVIYKAVGTIFEHKDREKANRVLRSFLKQYGCKGA